jgi:hypothetical protein
MKKYAFHLKWGEKYGLPLEIVAATYELIDQPVNQIEYLRHIVKVTIWWDDKDKENIPEHIKKECKTLEQRVKAEQKYVKYLSDHMQGLKARDKNSGLNEFQRKHLPPKLSNCSMIVNIFFSGRTTGRDLSRVKDTGDFQSYLQQKYLQPKGQFFLRAYYLHHIIDYCNENYETFPFDEIVRRNRERIKPIEPKLYDEVADYLKREFEELKNNFSE